MKKIVMIGLMILSLTTVSAKVSPKNKQLVREYRMQLIEALRKDPVASARTVNVFSIYDTMCYSIYSYILGRTGKAVSWQEVEELTDWFFQICENEPVE